MGRVYGIVVTNGETYRERIVAEKSAVYVVRNYSFRDKVAPPLSKYVIRALNGLEARFFRVN